MANVLRFALDSARNVHVPGVGYFRNGILDIDANNVMAIGRARFLTQPFRAIEIGFVDSEDEPPNLPPAPEDIVHEPDPYAQYLLPSELAPAMATVAAGDNAFTAAQRAAFDTWGGGAASSRPAALGKLDAGLSTRKVAPCRLAFTGSSTMEGIGASSPANSFARLLVAAFQAAYPSGTGTEHTPVTSFTAAFGTPSTAPGVQGYNAGKSGSTSAEYLTAGMITSIAGLNPRAVFHMVGSNDFRDSVDPTTYRANVRAKIDALNAAIAGPVVHILLHQQQRMAELGTVPWSAYRDALAAIADADADNVAFLDLSAPFELSGVPGSDPLNLVGGDNIHLTDTGHSLLFDTARRGLAIPAAAAVSGGSQQATLVADNFDRADAATLGTADTGQVWADGGAWTISGNKATASGNGYAFVDVGTGDMDVTADIYYLGGNVPAGIHFNSTDSGNRCVLYVNPTDSTHGTLILANFGGSTPGVSYTGPAGAVDCASGQVHRLRAVSKGAQLTAYLDGTQVWTYTMTADEQTVVKARTRAGLRQSGATAVSLDSFLVKAPA